MTKRHLPLFALALSAVTAAHATTYWLGTGANASDTNAGTSMDAPFATWEHAFAVLDDTTAAHTLNVLPGTYTLTGEPTAWARNYNLKKTIQGVKADGTPISTLEDAASVVIDGADTYKLAPVGPNPAGLTLRGITFQHGYGNAMVGVTDYDGGDNCTISTCVFQNCSGGAVFVLGGTNIVVEGCVFRKNVPSTSSPNSVLYLFGRKKAASSSANYIRNCTFEENGSRDFAAITANLNHNGIAENCIFRANITLGGHCAIRLGEYQWPELYPATVKDCVFLCNTNTQASVASSSAGILGTAATSHDAVISGCAFTNNVAGCGSTVEIWGSRATITGCSFSGNSANSSVDQGGTSGIYFYQYGASGTILNQISNCTFRANGSRIINSRLRNHVVITDSLFASNECDQIVFNRSSRVVADGLNSTNDFVRCTFDGNNISGDVTRYGMLQLGVGSLDRCKFTGNTSVGCTVVTYGGLAMTNCLFSGNSTTGKAVDGGGARIVYMFYAGVNSIVNSTFVNNSSGRATVLGEQPGDEIVNCLFSGNTWTESNSKLLQNSGTSHCFADFVPTGDWADVVGGTAGANPKFADATNGDFSLAKTSPCRNTGSNAPWTADGTPSGLLRSDIVDLADNARVNPDDVAFVDIGCYEWFDPDPNKPTLILLW